MLSQVMTGR